MLRVLVYVLPIAALLYGLLDLRRSEPYEREGLPLWGWVAVIVLLPVVGTIIWVALSTSRKRDARPGPSGRPSPGGRRPGGPGVAPDDDPDFLWRLEQERRRRRKGQPDPE